MAFLVNEATILYFCAATVTPKYWVMIAFRIFER
jgi:hypothetical protein